MSAPASSAAAGVSLFPRLYCASAAIFAVNCARTRSRSAGLYLVQKSASGPGNAKGSLLEELLDQIHVCHQHSSAAVALASELVHHITVEESVSISSGSFGKDVRTSRNGEGESLPLRNLLGAQLDISFPEVSNNLRARSAMIKILGNER